MISMEGNYNIGKEVGVWKYFKNGTFDMEVEY